MDINKALMSWGISNETIKQIYSSAWQIGDKYILKVGSNLQSLKSNLSIIKALSEQNIPAATVVKTVDGQDYVLIDGTYFFLSEKISGGNITDVYNGSYKEFAYLIGEIIGRLHIAFRACQEKISCYDSDFYGEVTGWVSQTFEDKNITLIPKHILNECVSELRDIYPKLPRQLIHRDIHMGNMLFQNNKLTGYIDFDLSQINARVFDLCYMSLGLLIDNVDDESKTAKWFEILQNILKGYGSLIPLTYDEIKAIPVMMIAIEMLFVAYFAGKDEPEGADGAAKMLMWLWENKEGIKNSLN